MSNETETGAPTTTAGDEPASGDEVQVVIGDTDDGQRVWSRQRFVVVHVDADGVMITERTGDPTRVVPVKDVRKAR